MTLKTVTGGLRGHVGAAARAAKAEGAQRAAARNILSERDVANGAWDANRVLQTTLGGELRAITADDLATFRRNMNTARGRFKGYSGITAQHVIDLASSGPLSYKAAQAGGAKSDIDKARSEILTAIPVSALHDVVRFRTSAGKGSKSAHHLVQIRFAGFKEGVQKAIAGEGSPSAVNGAANWVRKEKLAFDCDCERHRYFFRYVATIGGFNVGRDETGYPKIRNPNLRGVACKHVLRVMAEIRSSALVVRFLSSHIERSIKGAKSIQVSAKEAMASEARKRGKATEIKSSDARRAAARAAAVKRSVTAAAKKAIDVSPAKHKAAATRRLSKDQANAVAQFAKQFGMTQKAVLSLLEGKK